MKNTIVINFFGGPGIGKSTLAAKTFSKLKDEQIDCELISEYAKHATWEENFTALKNQFYTTAIQHHKEFIVLGKVDVIVTDCPLILGLMYFNDPNKQKEEYFFKFILEEFSERENLNYFILRTRSYNENGRNQTLNEAIQLDNNLKNLLHTNKIGYSNISYDEESINKILNDVKEKIS